MRTEPFTQEEVAKLMQPNHLERIAHALEVIAVRVGMMQYSIAEHSGSSVGGPTSEQINESVENIKNGGNY